jgi:hypothetical protein
MIHDTATRVFLSATRFCVLFGSFGGFWNLYNLICNSFCVLCALFQLLGIFCALWALGRGEILVTFNNVSFTVYEMCILQVQVWSFSVRGLVPNEWWLSVVLFTGPEVRSIRMKCAYCYVSLLLRNAFSVLLLGYCEVHYTVIRLIALFRSMTYCIYDGGPIRL